jgi:hypothetical protein
MTISASCLAPHLHVAWITISRYASPIHRLWPAASDSASLSDQHQGRNCVHQIVLIPVCCMCAGARARRLHVHGAQSPPRKQPASAVVGGQHSRMDSAARHTRTGWTAAGVCATPAIPGTQAPSPAPPGPRCPLQQVCVMQPYVPLTAHASDQPHTRKVHTPTGCLHAQTPARGCSQRCFLFFGSV